MKLALHKPLEIDRTKAVFLLIATAILWSFGGLLVKLITWNPIAIAGMRSAIAALLMLTVIKKPHFTWSFTQIGGAIAYAITVILFVMANKLTTAANAILLQYTAPVYVAIFSAWFLKERTKLIDWITIFFVLGGMVLFFIDDLSMGNLYGNVLAVISGVSFAFTAILLRKQKAASPMESVLLGNIVTAIIGVPFMFQSMPDTSSWIGLILLGVFQLGFSYIFYSAAIKHVTALEAILIPVLEPVLNPLWVLLVIGEVPGVWSLIGGFIVLASVTSHCVVSVLRSSR